MYFTIFFSLLATENRRIKISIGNKTSILIIHFSFTKLKELSDEFWEEFRVLDVV